MTTVVDDFVNTFQYIPELKIVETDETLPHHGLCFPILRYSVPQWSKVKYSIDGFMPKAQDMYLANEVHYTDADKAEGQPYYFKKVLDGIKPVLEDFQKFLPVPVEISNMNVHAFRKEMFMEPYQHSSVSNGFSGLLYVDYNRSIHGNTTFVLPTTDFIFGETKLYEPKVSEGDILFFPSYVWYYQKQLETSPYIASKQVSFNMHGKLHSSKITHGREYIVKDWPGRSQTLNAIMKKNCFAPFIDDR
tara:strand:+ start:3334 stop:4074 length:741 start_codon:yes stop_codon:yes gene_type:complete